MNRWAFFSARCRWWHSGFFSGLPRRSPSTFHLRRNTARSSRVGQSTRRFSRQSRTSSPYGNIESALPHLIWPINIASAGDDWKQIRENFATEWNWGIDVLYRTPGNDADKIVNAAIHDDAGSQSASSAILMAWSWRSAGPVAAIVAGILYCFDPNFLAHGSLATNDVAMSLCFFVWMWAIWKVGREANVPDGFSFWHPSPASRSW